MNKNILLNLLAVFPFMAFAQQSFTINGNLNDVTAPAKAYLVYAADGQRNIDSVNISNGKFVFTGQIPDATEAMLAVDPSGKGISQMSNPDLISLFLEEGKVSVQGTDLISKATLSGTPLNVDQQKLNEKLASVDAKGVAFLEAYEVATETERKAEGFDERMKKQYSAIQEERAHVVIGFIKSNPQSYISLTSLIKYAGPSPEAAEIEPLLNSLSTDLQEHPRAKALRTKIEVAQRLGIGSMAPDFTQNDPDGKPVSLSSFRGKYVLIDFWASWCGPCRQENPNLVAAYNEFKDKDFTILGVSLDRETGRNAWLKAIEDDQLTWTQVSDLKFWNNEVAELYGIRSIPQSYLLDPSGKIIAKNLRGEELHSKLAEILN